MRADRSDNMHPRFYDDDDNEITMIAYYKEWARRCTR